MLTATVNTISFKIERKLGYKFMPAALSVFFFAGFLMSIVFFLNISFQAKIVITTVSIVLQYISRNPYKLNIKNTMVTYYGGQTLDKMLSKYFIAENMGGAVFSLLASLCIEKLNLGYAAVIVYVAIAAIFIPSIIFYVRTLRKMEKMESETTEQI